MAGVVLRSLLTSSHLVPPAETDGIHGVFKRPQSQSVVNLMSQKLIARPPPPAFLFPIYNVKDPVGFRRPHCFAPVAGGGGYLVAGLFRVNRSFPTFFAPPSEPGFWRKDHCGPPRGFPH